MHRVMDGTGDDGDDAPPAPTLYVEPEGLDPAEAFCSEVVAEAPEGAYRVVQLTSAQSFETLRDALDVQLERINDPSEAAVIITTPHADDESTTATVGDGTSLYGLRVDPQDLTGISIAFSRLIEQWERDEGRMQICLRDVESLLPYHDGDLLYRFLHTVLTTLTEAGAAVHAHVRSTATDDDAFRMIESLFTHVVEPGDSPLDPPEEADTAPNAVDGAATAATAEPPSTNGAFAMDSEDITAASMSEVEVDAFLESEGHGVLALDGDSPYAVPMSYGYDADERLLFLQLSAYEGSEKQARLEHSGAVSLVVSRYDRPDRWRSVVVEGSLVALPQAAASQQDALDAFANGALATVDVFDRDLFDLSFDWYVLEPSSISGRRSAGSP